MTDSEMITLLVREGVVESQTRLGVILGMKPNYARTYLSNVKKGAKELAIKYRLMIIQLFPEFAERHQLIYESEEAEINNNLHEPKQSYSKEQKRLKKIEDHIEYLQQDVHTLKKQVEKLQESNRELQDRLS